MRSAALASRYFFHTTAATGRSSSITDDALEGPFDAVHEPYDHLVFLGTGRLSGRFVRGPWWDPQGHDSLPITMPNESVDLARPGWGARPDRHRQASRGAAELGPGWAASSRQLRPHRRQLHGYLTQGRVESLTPLQILNKIRDSHFVFLGYRVRDWSVRVFLRRVWGEHSVEREVGRIAPVDLER